MNNVIAKVLPVVLVVSTATAGWAAEPMTTMDKPMHDMDTMQSMMPKPTEKHAWLQQMVGEWKSETTLAAMEPGKAPMKVKGTESVEAVGPFWTVTDVKSTMMDQPFEGKMTLGYDAEKEKYVGTWVDSMNNAMWEYEGTVDDSGKKLTLEAEGMCPMTGKMTQFKETIEMKDNNHKRYMSEMLDDNGEWVVVMMSEATRK